MIHHPQAVRAVSPTPLRRRRGDRVRRSVGVPGHVHARVQVGRVGYQVPYPAYPSRPQNTRFRPVLAGFRALRGPETALFGTFLGFWQVQGALMAKNWRELSIYWQFPTIPEFLSET